MLSNEIIKSLSSREKNVEKHITYLNAFSHPMGFSYVIFHVFSHVVQVLSYANHCSGHNMYDFGSIMDFFVKSTNRLTLLVNYPNNATTTNITFAEPCPNIETSTSENTFGSIRRNMINTLKQFHVCIHKNFMLLFRSIIYL